MTEPNRSAPKPPHSPLPAVWWRVPLRTRRKIAVGVGIGIVVVAVVVIAMSFADDGPAEPDPAEFLAQLSPARIAAWEAVAECETEGDWGRATGNGFYGGLQFSQASWLEVGGTGSPHEASREEQIMRAELLHADQGWKAWPACSSELGLR